MLESSVHACRHINALVNVMFLTADTKCEVLLRHMS